MVGHIINHEAIPTHKHHASIFFHELFPRAKTFVTPRASFSQKYVSGQKKMHLEKVREDFVYHRAKKKNLLQILHRYHGLGEMSKLQAL